MELHIIKGPRQMAIFTLINVHEYTEILDNSLIPSIENWSGDDNASCHREKANKINNMVSKQDSNPTGNFLKESMRRLHPPKKLY